jgi:DNA polymerase I-like protein with 3'-5' exonuclease and polymerase domains
LELRCLAHYLAPYDDGAFGTELLEGDIHTRLAEIYGTDRKNGKTVTYCMIYGGGNAKLGLAAGATKAKAVARGKAIRKAVMDGLTGFKELMDAVSAKAETGQIRGLDGRIIRIKKPHAALNYLLQSAGAIICKNWVVNMNHYFRGMDVQHCAFVHDEVQLSIAPDLLPKVTEILHQSMTDVQSLFQFRIELACEVVSGDSWGATH